MPLPALPELSEVRKRLEIILPPGMPGRQYSVREMAAKSVFTMLYIGAVEGTERWLSPKQVCLMSDRQSRLREDPQRAEYAENSAKPGYRSKYTRWYADNSREPIRDETLRNGLIPLGAVITRPGVPTTSAKGRYALQLEFARLFDPELRAEALESATVVWRSRHLSADALARVAVMRGGAIADKSKLLVKLPNGEIRAMEAGPSSLITKAVVEAFAPKFLHTPALLWISQSGNKVVARDDELARRIGLRIDPSRVLPDVILVDVREDATMLIFVEAVATEGAIDDSRKKELLRIATDAGFRAENTLFVSAFLDRGSPEFRRSLPKLAWGSLAWCASEPEHLIQLNGIALPGRR